MAALDVNQLYNSLVQGSTIALSKSITLLESTLESHQELANQLLDKCLNHTGNSIRIAVTGVPGVGKSTFIDAFGKYLIEHHNKKVAVLAIDPTSQKTRGSILGDKTRMNYLSVSDQSFVRPSPSGDTLGGVASETRESILLCEAAGFDVILVETVGVGQSETLVHNMVDFFLLLLLPGAGDELQGIKRGIVEMADMIAINKSDASPKLAKEAKQHYKNALHLMQSTRAEWGVRVEMIDSLSGTNMDLIYDQIQSFVSIQKANGLFESGRKEQSVLWLNQHIDHVFRILMKNNDRIQERLNAYQDKVSQNSQSPRSAAQQFIKELIKLD
ncbi:MAG: methylmalonyl Co-A mutase-associated GTPase MeaB [Bacteroidetes bacterium]|jgi:LAO/AO transport system kinase|nr:methylmalonyl Co-A mutase-associated GTPase MeaB [Bacteroidota bacterium]